MTSLLPGNLLPQTQMSRGRLIRVNSPAPCGARGDRVTLRPLRDAADFQALLKHAHADNHLVISPTHIVDKRGEIVGYISFNSVPMVQGWFDTQRMKARDSARAIHGLEGMARENGFKWLTVLIPTDSPFTPLMSRFGYARLPQSCKLHFKTFNT